MATPRPGLLYPGQASLRSIDLLSQCDKGGRRLATRSHRHAKGRPRTGNRPLSWVELRGFEPLTPSMRSMVVASEGVALDRVRAAQDGKAVRLTLTRSGVSRGRCHLARHW